MYFCNYAICTPLTGTRPQFLGRRAHPVPEFLPLNRPLSRRHRHRPLRASRLRTKWCRILRLKKMPRAEQLRPLDCPRPVCLGRIKCIQSILIYREINFGQSWNGQKWEIKIQEIQEIQ